MNTQEAIEINRRFEEEKELITKQDIYFLFGYYIQPLIDWFKSGYRKLNEEQAKELIEMLWTKLKENTK